MLRSKLRPDGRSLGPGSSQPVLSDKVNMNGQTAVRDTAICADCGQREDMRAVRVGWAVGQWMRDSRSESVHDAIVSY